MNPLFVSRPWGWGEWEGGRLSTATVPERRTEPSLSQRPLCPTVATEGYCQQCCAKVLSFLLIIRGKKGEKKKETRRKTFINLPGRAQSSIHQTKRDSLVPTQAVFCVIGERCKGEAWHSNKHQFVLMLRRNQGLGQEEGQSGAF